MGRTYALEYELLHEIDPFQVRNRAQLRKSYEYYRIYKGMRLFIKVKGDYGKLCIWDWHRRRCLDVWFDGRVRRDYKDEVEDVQKGMEARANEWIEMMADGYYDYFEPDEDDSILGFDDWGEAQ